MKHKIVKSLLLLTFVIHLTSAVTHSLQYIYTAVTPGIKFPEFTAVGLVDGEQFIKYDSNTANMTATTEWIKKLTADDPDYWNSETQISLTNQETFKINLYAAMARFNQTKGVHTVQMMYSCELHDDGTKTAYMQYGYDGEDFLILDLKTLTWIATTPQAVITKHKWDATAQAAMAKNYLENTCIEWLQKYVSYGRDTLERKVRPEVSLFQKDSFSPVVCHATGFFPKAVMISWLRNDEDVKEDVRLIETLLNQDGTFQKRSILRVSPEELNKNEYKCVVQHSSLEEDIVMSVEDLRVSDVSLFVLLTIVLPALTVPVLFTWCNMKKKTDAFDESLLTKVYFSPVNYQ